MFVRETLGPHIWPLYDSKQSLFVNFVADLKKFAVHRENADHKCSEPQPVDFSHARAGTLLCSSGFLNAKCGAQALHAGSEALWVSKLDVMDPTP